MLYGQYIRSINGLVSMCKIGIVVPSVSGGGSEKSLIGFLENIPEAFTVRVYYLSGDFADNTRIKCDLSFVRLPSRSFKSIKVLTLLRLNLIQFRPDVLVAWSRGPARIVAILSFILPKCNLVFSCRDFYKLDSSWKDKLYLISLRRFDFILSNSKENLAYLQTRVKNNNCQYFHLRNIVRIPYDKDSRVHLSKASTVNVCLIGRVVHQKGFDIFFDSIRYLRNGTPLNVNIFGDGSMVPELQKKVKDLSTSVVKVVWNGFVSNVSEELTKMDLVVFPSRHEGYPNVLLEAFAMRVPVISSDCMTGPKEIVGLENDRGLLFKTESAVDLAESINYFLTNREDASHKADIAFEWLRENFSHEAIRTNYTDVISRISHKNK